MKSILTLIIIAISSLTGISQVDRTLVVEHYTNTLCSTCASRNVAFFDLLDDYPQVLHISYHPSSPYSNCVFNQHNSTENDDRTHYYGIYGGTPRVVLQGEVIGFQTPMLEAGQIEAQLGKKSDYMITASQEKADANQVDVQIVVKLVAQPNTQSHKLYVIISEKKINYNAPNGEDEHHNVFRKVLLDQVINVGSAGDSVIINASYDIHGDWQDEELIVTAMVQDENTKAILQAFESDKLDAGSSFISDGDIISLDGVLYPNPANDVIHLNHTASTFLKAEFYALTGNLVASFLNPSSMDISELPEGIYMVILTDDSQQRHISRIIKR